MLVAEPNKWFKVADLRREIHLDWFFDGNFKTLMKQLVADGLVEKDVVDKKDVYRATEKLVGEYEPVQQGKINKLQSARRVVLDRLAEIRNGREIPNADIVDSTIDELLEEPTLGLSITNEAQE
jgi:hypothetical protein